MSKLVWDEIGKRYYESGVSKAVLYPMTNEGYGTGVAWDGLTAVNESPSGGEPTALWANNKKYASLMSAEELGLTIEAYTYPDEFEACNGQAEIATGVTVGQQERKKFGFAYRTEVGSDTTESAGYKLHLVYGCSASPSETNHSTINDSPDVSPMSWTVTTTPVQNSGAAKPTACLTIDSRKVSEDKMKAIEEKLYGGEGTDKNPTLPMPVEIAQIIGESTGA